MSAPASEDLRELERELVNAADAGETRSLNALRESFPDWSREQLLEALGSLREHGKAVEEAPGDWRAPLADDARRAAEPPRVVVSVEDGDGGPERARALVAGEPTGPRVALVAGEPTVRLTRSIAEALDADALGKVIQAALNGLEDGEMFVLEVTP